MQECAICLSVLLTNFFQKVWNWLASARIDSGWHLQTHSRETSVSSRTNWHIPKGQNYTPFEKWSWVRRLVESYVIRLYHVKAVIRQDKDKCGVGLNVSNNIHFVNVELFYSAPPHHYSITDTGTNIAAQMGAFKCPWRDNTSFIFDLSSICLVTADWKWLTNSK